MALTPEELEPFLGHIRALPFIRSVRILRIDPHGVDARIRLNTVKERHELLVEVKRTHLTRPLVDGLLARANERGDRPWILFAPYVGRPMGEYLVQQGVNYVDTAGNCHLGIGEEQIALIQGKRRQPRKGAGRGIGVAGYKALFVILARPDLLNAPVRTLAREAAIGKTAAAAMVERLVDEGLVGVDRNRRRILDRQTLIDRWLTGYATMVRPRLLIGNYRTPDDRPQILENRIEESLGQDLTWAWGGGAAAMRITGHYRGETTTMHVEEWTDAQTKRLCALPAPDGPLAILLAPGKLAFEGVAPGTVHPLLVYTELLTVGTARAREAAADLRAEYLEATGEAAL